MTIHSQKKNQSIINKRRKQIRSRFNKQYNNQPTQRQKQSTKTFLTLILTTYLITTTINIIHAELLKPINPSQPTTTLQKTSPQASQAHEISTITQEAPKTTQILSETKTTPKSATAPISLMESKQTTYTKDEIKSIIIEVAQKNNFQWINYLLKLAYFESGFNYNALNDKNRNKTRDLGIFQINDCHHLTDTQRLDPYFSTQWTIDKINEGKQHIWMADKIAKKSNLIFYNN